MPRKRESVGKALRRALGEEVILPKIEPRKSGVSHLMNQRRLLTFQAILNKPGVHLRELHRDMGIPLQSLRWHVSVLRGAGIIESVTLGRKTALFSPISANRHDIVMMTSLRDERFDRMMRMMERDGEVSVRQIVEETDSYQQLVSARLKMLKSLGIVISQGSGARTRYRLTAARTAELDFKEARESLIALFASHGLAPKVSQQSGHSIVIAVETPSGEAKLQFKM